MLKMFFLGLASIWLSPNILASEQHQLLMKNASD
jgi:hypothetical protein